ncbi:MAG: PD40 domain-containing protein [Ignavibacteriales bacterium]|nr:PD40 domain-containing protein [Ignavibacteriales bacterium]
MKLFTLGLLLVVFTQLAFGQFFYFGRNKVQYTQFNWHVLKTEHFDIYYYPEMKELAERGAAFAEESYKALEQKFNHNVGNKIPLIFYSSHLHFQQTNTTPGFLPEGVGGFFEFLKGRVVIPFNGSLWDFRHVIRHELVHVFMHSKVTRVLTDHRLPQDRFPPLWFTEGLAEYWSVPNFREDIQAEMVMRDAVVNNYVVPLDNMSRIYGSFLMYKEGQNILQFVAERYGDEKVLLLMENIWKATSFEEIFKLTLNKSYEEFDNEWTYWLKKTYYPLLALSDQPSAASKAIVTEGFNAKPVFYQYGNRKEIYFIGNHSGYTSIYRVPFDSAKAKPELVIEGERTDELEAFHLFQSKLSISTNGQLAFVTKSGENDVLHIYDIEKKIIVQTLKFDSLVVLGSPSWSPDGKRIVFSSVDKSGSSDLYIRDNEHETLTRLTNDFYDDKDPAWSPDGKWIAFSSDRTPFGKRGKYNLFLLNVSNNDIEYLTYGDESYYSPSWSPDGKKLVFTSELEGARNVWCFDFAQHDLTDLTPGPSPFRRGEVIRKLTYFTTAAFDPSWTDSGLVFTAFENFSFQIRNVKNVQALFDSSKTIKKLDFVPLEKPWQPKTITATDSVDEFQYTGDYSLDIAGSQISTDPVFGTSGGAYLSLSDLLGNEQYYFLLYNTAQTTDEILESFNIAISRMSLQKRTNYAYGVYRFSGRRYDLRDPDLYFFERVFGGYFALSHPLSKFRRIEATTSLSNSDKEVIYSVGQRRALFLSNSISFVHDNSLSGPSGPLDGSRFNVTLAYTTDIQYSNANYYSAIFDYRHYFRISQRSAYAVRVWLFYNEGKEARRFFMGGSWDLRGYPRWSLRGKKLWLTSHELRFPFLDQIAIKFPFGGVSFIGLRGALFFDAGNAWDEEYKQTLGSLGGGVRLNIGGAFVLRFDVGKKIVDNFQRFDKEVFQQFFFGWDF